jgi:hypothetical protein
VRLLLSASSVISFDSFESFLSVRAFARLGSTASIIRLVLFDPLALFGPSSIRRDQSSDLQPVMTLVFFFFFGLLLELWSSKFDTTISTRAIFYLSLC